MMKKVSLTRCYSCTNFIDQENKSEEHIIPNSIGGKIKSFWLLCRDCNSRFGNTIDSDLAKSYEDIVALLNLKRDRPKEYIIKNLTSSDGENYHLINGRTPTPVKPTIKLYPKQNKFQITARDQKQLEEIIKGLKRKYPNLDDSNFKEKLSGQNTYLQTPLTLKMKFGGERYLRAIAKMAINFYLHQGGDQMFLTEIIKVLKKEIENDDHIHFSFIDTEVIWQSEELSHQIYINGIKEKKLIYAYIILFSANAFIVNLSEDYLGEDMEMGMSYDILTGANLEKIIAFKYSGRADYKADVINNGTELNKKYISSIQNNLSRVMNISNVHQTRESMKELNEKSLKDALAKYGNPDFFTKEIFDDYINSLTERIVMFFAHIEKQKNRKTGE